MRNVTDAFRSKDYWIVENAKYEKASFRLRKSAQIINAMAKDKKCTLLDVGCGPAALRPLLAPNIGYYGIDIAIQNPAPYLREFDTSREPIAFGDQQFDFVVAMGFFEYMGTRQKEKFEEIKAILKPYGKFIISYINFGHFRRRVWPNYNNVQSIDEMRDGLKEVFKVDRYFPASHHVRQKQPGSLAIPGLQMHVNYRIPVFSPLLAVEYLFICSQQNASSSV